MQISHEEEMSTSRPSAGSTAPSHLDRIGADEFMTVIRYLSKRPRSTHWQSDVSARDVASVLKLGGPFAACARRSFSSLGLFCGEKSAPALYVDERKPHSAALFQYLLAELAPALEGLSVTSPLRVEGIPFERCTSLRCLHLLRAYRPTAVRKILSACRGSLRELALGGAAFDSVAVNAVAENCRGLQKLRMNYQQASGDLRLVWEVVGPTLVDLSLNMRMLESDDPFDLTSEIAAYCVVVSAFGYIGMSYTCDWLVQLCVKFGKKLTSLRFENFTRWPCNEQITRILDACPDLRIDADSNGLARDSVAIFRDRLRSVFITDKLCGDVKEEGKSVPSLEKLSVAVGFIQHSGTFFSNFLFSPKPALKSLKLIIGNRPIQPDNNPLDVIARLGTSLEELIIEADWIGKGVFRRIAETNNELSYVSVSCWMDFRFGQEAEDAAVSLVEDFVQCANLKTLVLISDALSSTSARISKASLGYGTRAVDIFIGGVQYGQ